MKIIPLADRSGYAECYPMCYIVFLSAEFHPFYNEKISIVDFKEFRGLRSSVIVWLRVSK